MKQLHKETCLNNNKSVSNVSKQMTKRKYYADDIRIVLLEPFLNIYGSFHNTKVCTHLANVPRMRLYAKGSRVAHVDYVKRYVQVLLLHHLSDIFLVALFIKNFCQHDIIECLRLICINNRNNLTY